MERDSGVGPPAAGSFLNLSEAERRFYSGLRSRCQAESGAAAALSSGRVTELLQASQLHPDALRRVTEVCGAKRLGYFGTPQLYVALKLLAAAQSGLPIRLESVTADLPLPRFVGLNSDPAAEGQSAPAVSVPWTPAERRHLDTAADHKDSWSPPRSPSSSPPRSPLTYRSYTYAKKSGADAPLVYESKHFSPKNYGTHKPTAEDPAMARASSAERLSQQGVQDDPEDDPWRITDEQLEYYTHQFRSLQPDLGALILGAVAKNFFTKSKLPIPELSHIWDLSDVDRDGALTFCEFCTAFHLIVARKNGYPLPESLPPTLQLGFTQQEAAEEEEEEEEVLDTPGSAEPLILFEDAELRPSQMVNRATVTSSSLTVGGANILNDRSILERIQPTTKQDFKEETREQDGSMKRVTTSLKKQTLHLGSFLSRPEPPPELDPQMRTKTRPRSYSSTSIEDAMKKVEEPPTPPPRPQKSHSRASSLDLNKLLAQGAPGVKGGCFLPPALPPRPSSSQVPHFIKTPEKKPPAKVQQQQPNFADFSHFREAEESRVQPEEQRFGPNTEDLANVSKQDVPAVCPSQAPQKPVRRKYHPESQNPECAPPPATSFPHPLKPAPKLLSRQKRAIQMLIRKNKETNAVLTRLNSELQQQLKVVHQERVTLESQLDAVRPLAST